jgi:hypothetical protein
VQKKQQELEDMQLEKQIEALRRELEEAKTGVFMKATARMDDMQAETDKMKEQVTDTQGRVQVNRENIEELEQVLRDAGASISTTSKVGLLSASPLFSDSSLRGGLGWNRGSRLHISGHSFSDREVALRR